jgi:hypothetical protein
MSDIRHARNELVSRLLDGDGTASRTQRRAAFDNAGLSEPVSALVAKVVDRAHDIIDEDVAAVRASGLSEDQIFEIVLCAAVGQAARQYESALAAIDAATGKA